MTSPLENTNPYGIRVVADRAPLRKDAKAAFDQASRKATTGINNLVQPRRRATVSAARTRAR